MAALLAVLWFGLHVSAQIGDRYKGFKLLDYYKPSNRLKSETTGAEALTEANGLVLVSQARIKSFLQDGRTNLIATAPHCFIDYKERVAFSPGPLEVQTADGQLNIRGTGFFYEQTNFNLVISNQVETTIHRELIRSTNASALPFQSPSKTNALSSTNQLIKIFSDRFVLDSASNLALYSGRVRVEDEQLELTCETLTLHRSTNGSLETIVADRNVAVTNKQDHSRATGDQAVYSLSPDQELVVLTGQQARWQEGPREAKAGSFAFDRRANTLRAEQKPWVRLPRSAFNQSDWLPGPIAVTNAPPKTNQFFEIKSEEMTFHLATTNQPSRRLVAQRHVEMISPGENTRATGDLAFYNEATGTVELTGNAAWQADERLVKAQALSFDRTNKVLNARGDAYLKMPLSTLGGRTHSPSDPQKLVLPETVEVFSDQFVYNPTALTFHQNVRANYFRGPVRSGGVTCSFLSLELSSNRLDTVLARGSVALEQFAGTNIARRVDKKLNCEDLTIHIRTNGLVQSVFAQTNVVALQTETRPGHPQPVQTRVTAGTANTFFFDHTNQVREFVAEHDVSITQDAQSAHGQKAVYTATNDVLELSGHPTVQSPMVRVTEADVLIWDRAHNNLRAKGTRVAGQREVPGKGTNGVRSLFRR